MTQRVRPILFSAPMVRAILDGTKSQTRRTIYVPAPPSADEVVHTPRHPAPYLDAYCSQRRTATNPRGMSDSWCWWTRDDRACEQFSVRFAPGDLLWVKETTVIAPSGWTSSPVQPRGPEARETGYFADKGSESMWEAAQDYGLKKTPSIFMPRWASRITLEVTAVAVERLQEIDEADALAEGCPGVLGANPDFPDEWDPSPVEQYRDLWQSINGKRHGATWGDNPWVVVVSFRHVGGNIDEVLAGNRTKEPAT